MQQVKIQVLFSEETKYGKFQDALYYTEDEWKTVKQADIDVAKKARKDKWLEIITAPSIELTLEEQAAQLQEQIDILQAELNKLGA